jgi:SAM-dependent methyltransferase
MQTYNKVSQKKLYVERANDTFHFLLKEITSTAKWRAITVRNNSKESRSDGSYCCIPYYIHDFIYCLWLISEFFRNTGQSMHNKCFVDAGCGIGDKVLMALVYLECNAIGLEIDDETISDANFIFGDIVKKRVIKGDILKHDYSKYDIIYYYQPIAKRDKEEQFEKLVEETCKVGAIIFAPHKISCIRDTRFEEFVSADRFPTIYDRVPLWIKVS